MHEKLVQRGKKARNAGAANDSRRTSAETAETDKKIAKCINSSARGTPANAKKLGENSEITRQEAVCHEFRTALQQ